MNAEMKKLTSVLSCTFEEQQRACVVCTCVFLSVEHCHFAHRCIVLQRHVQGFCDKDGDWSDQPATALGVMEVSSGCLPR